MLRKLDRSIQRREQQGRDDMKIAAHRRRRLEREPEYALAMAAVHFEESLADLVVARRAARLSQAELARLAGTTQATVSQVENGVANPRASTIAKLLSVLGLNGGAAVNALVRSTASPSAAAKRASTPSGRPRRPVGKKSKSRRSQAVGEGHAPVLGPKVRSLLGVLRKLSMDKRASRPVGRSAPT